MSSLESGIDALYKGLLDDFIAGRAALARTLTGDEAKRVKALAKPTVVPWAANQVYWHARSVFDRLRASGAKLRDAQLAVLAGRSADIRRAADAHRADIARAVAEATRQAAAVHLKPDVDALTRTFEAISLAPDTQALNGRLTKPLQPAGFEALANAVVKPLARREQQQDEESSRRERTQPSARTTHEREQRDVKKAHERARQEALAARRRAAAIDKARDEVEKAVKAEERARVTLEERRRVRQEKERVLAELEKE